MIRYFIKVTGMVQGVGFRYFVYMSARSLKITGWVRNCPDGSVDIEAQGKKNNILTFTQKLKEGNGFSETDSVEMSPIDISNHEEGFKLLF